MYVCMHLSTYTPMFKFIYTLHLLRLLLLLFLEVFIFCPETGLRHFPYDRFGSPFNDPACMYIYAYVNNMCMYMYVDMYAHLRIYACTEKMYMFSTYSSFFSSSSSRLAYSAQAPASGILHAGATLRICR